MVMKILNDKNHYCRVCGLYSEELPYGEDGKSPTYDICYCCGVEFGYEDYTVESTLEYRTKWISEGAKWFTPKEKPDGWNLEEQLKQVPDGFK